MLRVIFGLTLSLALLLASSAQAAMVYQVFYRIDGVDAIDSVIQATPGQMFSGEVVIRETVTNPSVSALSSGLISFSADLGTIGGDATFSGLGKPSVFLTTPLTSPTTASGFAFVFAAPVPAAILPNETSPGSGVYDFSFATFNLTAPSTVGQTTLFTLADSQPQPSVSNFETFDADIDDSSIAFRGFTISTAVAVPEPSSVALLAGVALFVTHRLRRKMKSVGSVVA